MPKELLYPFSLNKQGGIASTTDINLIPQQHVEALIGTTPGERVMLARYGIPVSSYVFDHGVDAVIAGLTNDVQQAMAFWEPTLTVIDVTPAIDSSNEDYGLAAINVDFTQAENTNNSAANTGTVEVGGKVTEKVISNASNV